MSLRTKLSDTIPAKFPATPTIGITYDTRDDFEYASDDPWDWAAEFEVSVAIGDIANAIEDLGFPTVMIGSAAKLLDGFSAYRKEVQMVFNIAEGKMGRAREAQVPSILEAGGIAYVGSDAETLAIGLNKAQTKYNALAHGIRTPEFVVVSDVAEMRQDQIPEYPVILKLTHGGSSMGVDEKSKINDFAQLKRHVRYLLRTYRQDVLVERFIEGPEFDVPILGTKPDDAFGVVEVTLNGKSMGENHLTSRIVYRDDYGLDVVAAEGDFSEYKAMALKAYNSLRCRDFGRVDIRVDESTGKPYFLEINPYPYLGPHSSFNYVAKSRGMEYKDMMGVIMESALRRYA
ncbi:MAG: hypothetical protein J4F28_08185 [Nitrosopumilaceae archaeon]|nr:hypothetical protein [Nitrosopumilaceae archaeon]